MILSHVCRLRTGLRTGLRLGLRSGLTAVALSVALAACAAETEPGAIFLSRLDWPASAHGLGGFSGLEMSSDGVDFIAISDRGAVIKGQLTRENNRLPTIVGGQVTPLRDPDGVPLRDAAVDAEGLALRDDGRLFVSFEGLHRVWAYLSLDAAARLPRPRAFRDLQGNSGFEALAIDAQGRLYTLPERSGRLSRPFPVWRYQAGVWSQPFALPRRGGFLPVGADFGPDGLFYLLEREFTGIGFRSRVRRFSLAEDRILTEDTLLETPVHRHGNLEGLAVWQDASGAIRLTMLSDDNFNSFQRSEFVEYRVTD
jgi:hypothetical protein